MKAMILAAGHGTRLRPLTAEIPKVMVPIAGYPLLQHSIEWLRGYGISEIGINLHFMPEVVTTYFGDGSRFGVHLRYSVEDRLRGTAGGVKLLEEFLNERFVLLYGDVLTDLDLDALIDFHMERLAAPHLTMALYHVANPTECGIVSVAGDGRVSRFVEKPTRDEVFSDLANAGVLVVDPEAVTLIPAEIESDFGREMFPFVHPVRLPDVWMGPSRRVTPDRCRQSRTLRVGAPPLATRPLGCGRSCSVRFGSSGVVRHFAEAWQSRCPPVMNHMRRGAPMPPSRPAVFLDRDGVLIEDRPTYVRSVDDMAMLPRAAEAVGRLARSDFAIVMITNQSVIGRGHRLPLNGR